MKLAKVVNAQRQQLCGNKNKSSDGNEIIKQTP